MTIELTSKEQFDALPENIRWRLYNEVLVSFIICGTTLFDEDVHDLMDEGAFAEDTMLKTKDLLECINASRSSANSIIIENYFISQELELQMRLDIAKIVMNVLTSANAIH